ncbi:hypothetical protein [Parasediminibacterium sp. JCM 36343]|uniref:hypothetical protein n=1 Tax=Parasediminibacterium sp. JCM 36343 TaxID=3374279 RepID=UPI00397B0707
MYREITVVNAPTYQIEIPTELQGKKIEIIAFEIENKDRELVSTLTKLSFLERTKHLSFNSNGYKFNRDEANDYE